MGTEKKAITFNDAYVKRLGPGKHYPGTGNGLLLDVNDKGRKVWRVRYRLDGAERMYTVGKHPDYSVRDADAEAERVQTLAKSGRDPVVERRVTRKKQVDSDAKTLKVLTEEWLAAKKQDWSAVHYTKAKQALERDVLPKLGAIPVAELTPVMVTNVLKTVSNRAPETALKIRQHVGMIGDMAMALGLRDTNFAPPGITQVFKRPEASKRHPALLKEDELRQFMKELARVRSWPEIRLCIQLVAHTVVRIGEAVPAEWSEFHLNGKEPVWEIPRARMKVQSRSDAHIVPLPPRLADTLREWHKLTGKERYVFASPSSKLGHITREACEKLVRDGMGYGGRHSLHGFRTSLSSLAHDSRKFDEATIEYALDHTVGSQVAAAYRRTTMLQQRRELMKWWEDTLTPR